MIFLKILAFILLGAGFLTVFGAKWIVKRYRFNEKAKCEFENEMSPEELELYKMNKAVINTKMLGMLVALPGLILILVVFR